MDWIKIKELIRLEAKMIVRNQRVYILFIVALTMSISYYFNLSKGVENELFNSYTPVLKSFTIVSHFLFCGLVMVSYMQFMISWESGYINLLFTLNLEKNIFFVSKYLTGTLINLLSTLVQLIIYWYFDFSKIFYYLSITAFFYNTGVGLHFILISSIFNERFVDFNKKKVLNYGLFNIYQSFSLLLILAVVFIISIILYSLKLPNQMVLLVLFLLGLIGFTGVLTILKYPYQKLKKRKYKLLNSFNN